VIARALSTPVVDTSDRSVAPACQVYRSHRIWRVPALIWLGASGWTIWRMGRRLDDRGSSGVCHELRERLDRARFHRGAKQEKHVWLWRRPAEAGLWQACVLPCFAPRWSGAIEPLAQFMTNPAGAAVVNAVGPIRQIVQPDAPSQDERRYLAIFSVENGKPAAGRCNCNDRRCRRQGVDSARAITRGQDGA